MKAMKTDVTAVGAGIYEPPRMTMVPVRTSGSLLVGSAGLGYMQMQVEEETWLFRYIQLDDEPGNTATEWDNALTSDWGDNFF